MCICLRIDMSHVRLEGATLGTNLWVEARKLKITELRQQTKRKAEG